MHFITFSQTNDLSLSGRTNEAVWCSIGAKYKELKKNEKKATICYNAEFSLWFSSLLQ